MAQVMTNKAKFDAATGVLVFGTTVLTMGLLTMASGTLPSGARDPDLNTVSDLLAVATVAEASASGYARQTLGSVAATEDDTNDRVNVDCADVAFGAIATGDRIVGAFIYSAGANDAARHLISVYDLTATPTNGGTITVPVADFLRNT